MPPQLFRQVEQNHKVATQNAPNGQVYNPKIPTEPQQVNSNINYRGQIQQQFPIGLSSQSKPAPIGSNPNYPGQIQQQFPIGQSPQLKQAPIGSNTNYPGSIQQKFFVKQNVNQLPSKTNFNGYENPPQDTSSFLNGQSNLEGSQFLFDQNNYERPNIYETPNYDAPFNYESPDNNGNDQETQDTSLNEQKQHQNIRFPSVKENSPIPQTGIHGNQKSVSSNINPNSWMRGQLKGKKGANQNSYSNNGYTNEEFQEPHNLFNKPASTFDLGHKQQIDQNKEVHIENSYDSSQSYLDHRQPLSLSNGQGHNINSPPQYLASDFNRREPQQNAYPNLQDRQMYVDSKMNKQFQIVVPNISYPTDNIEQQILSSPKSPSTKSSKELNSNKGSSGYNTIQYPNKNKNLDLTQNPSDIDNSQSPSQESIVYSSSASSCPKGFSGIKPHPTDCSKFISCASGRQFEMNCGPGTLFNPTISVCDHPYNVECNRIVVTTTTPTTTEDYNPPIDLRQPFDHDTSSSDLVTETYENHNQAVLETLPTENRQFKVLRNPSSVDLPDNFLPNSSIMHTPPKEINNLIKNNVTVRIDLKPNSTQAIRLRGSPKNYEGFLQVQEKPFQWGVVCDEINSWTINKADIVCKQLGFKRY